MNNEVETAKPHKKKPPRDLFGKALKNHENRSSTQLSSICANNKQHVIIFAINIQLFYYKLAKNQKIIHCLRRLNQNTFYIYTTFHVSKYIHNNNQLIFLRVYQSFLHPSYHSLR